ncbi:hypothetical protein NDU88_007370 [Pleurodeles waltl]|uniref:ribonuclease H n=1 Tax=Pleurodeles waltl TaxID=8319 RepID=A0AAV7VPJ5_PLEWA|nr:hypothetical protein NDU88_007370 [Pleurodeles waltl]
MERYSFGIREQGKDESVEYFVRALRKLVASCKFGALTEERIRDQFVLNCFNDKIREELWLKAELLLEEVIAIAKPVEHIMKCVGELSKENKLKSTVENVSEVVCLVQHKPSTSEGKDSASESKTTVDFKGTCFRCGRMRHKAYANVYPAINVTCNRCGKISHYARCCKRKNNKEQKQEIKEIVFQVNEVKENEHPSELVNVENCRSKMKFDSCSQLALISKIEFDNNFADKVRLPEPDVKPTRVGGSPVKMFRYFFELLEYNGRFTDTKIYVADKGDNLLSWPHQGRLGVTLNPSADPPVQIHEVLDDGNKFLSMFKELFKDELGCLHDYKHPIRLQACGNPVVAKVRGIPISIQEGVQKEITKLVGKGIRESVEVTEWLAPIVVAKKPNNEIRLCADLRALNRKVILNRFPLPNTDEMVSTIGGAKYFTTLDLASANHQVALDKTSQELTAFITPIGQFKLQ